MELDWLELIVIILASFRLTRLIVYDQITAFIRKPFFTEVEKLGEDGQWMSEIHYKGGKIRNFIGQWLSCHWCAGIWCAAAVVAIMYMCPAAYPLVIILAAAGAAAVVETIVSAL